MVAIGVVVQDRHQRLALVDVISATWTNNIEEPPCYLVRLRRGVWACLWAPGGCPGASTSDLCALGGIPTLASVGAGLCLSTSLRLRLFVSPQYRKDAHKLGANHSATTESTQHTHQRWLESNRTPQPLRLFVTQLYPTARTSTQQALPVSYTHLTLPTKA